MTTRLVLNNTTPLKFFLSLHLRKKKGGKGIIEDRRSEFIYILLEFGADINTVVGGATAFIDATEKKDTVLIEHLIAMGPNRD